MTKTTRLVLLAAAVVLAAGAVVYFMRHERVSRPVRIVGKTVGPGDRPLADVRIVLEVTPGDSEEEAAVERVETLSDANGDFSINFVGHWKQASYRLEAQKPGFQKLSIEDAHALPEPVILRFAAPPS
jgi:hypothetical protein